MRITVAILAVITIALAALWKIYLPASTNETPIATIEKQIPDSYMTQVTLLKYDDTGALRQQLTAYKVVHLEHENSYFYYHPKLTWHDNRNQNWLLSAVHGLSKDGKDNIELWQDVLLQHQLDNQQIDTTATTTNLSANTKTQNIDTDKMVRIEHPGVVITGRGLHGDMSTGLLSTLAQTETTFTPHG